MAAIAINRFSGMVPRLGKQVLPEGFASVAQNCLLLSGELRALHGKAVAHDFRPDVAPGYTVARAYRIPDDSGNYDWVSTDDATHDLVKGPLINDAYDRYYSSSDVDSPRMNTRARLVNGDPSFLLGIPAPSASPAVAPSGGSGEIVTRAYTYTLVSAYGEEGQPVDATIATGYDNGTWALTGMDITVPDAAERNITTKNIYRTVTAANGVSEYHFVASVALATATYNDTVPTLTVALNNTLASIDYATPPDDLRGIIAHPNGFLVGFSGRDLYFSVPYLPHAWPAGYVLSTRDPIVGLGVFGTTIVVATTGFPVMLSGIRPENLTFMQSDTPEPCVSDRRSIVSMPFGVYYPTANGLLLVGAGGFMNATQSLLTKDEWIRDFSAYTLKAARWQSQYVAFYDTENGFMFAPEETQASFVELGDGAWAHESVQNDIHSADLFLIRENVVYYWNPTFGSPQTYLWRSKDIIFPKPVNLGALKLEFAIGEGTSDEVIADAQAWNDVRFQYPLNPIAFAPLNMVRKIDTIPGYAPPDLSDQISQPMHQSPLINIDQLQNRVAGTLGFRLYADDVLIVDIPIQDEEVYRLPDGYKSKRYYFELYGSVDVASVKIAETSKELMTV